MYTDALHRAINVSGNHRFYYNYSFKKFDNFERELNINPEYSIKLEVKIEISFEHKIGSSKSRKRNSGRSKKMNSCSWSWYSGSFKKSPVSVLEPGVLLLEPRILRKNSRLMKSDGTSTKTSEKLIERKVTPNWRTRKIFGCCQKCILPGQRNIGSNFFRKVLQ